MKQFKLVVLITLICTTCVCSQPVNFSFNRPAVKNLDSIEAANNGKTFVYEGITFGLSKNYFPGSDNFKLGQPINSNRLPGATSIQVSYYYSLPDSIIRLAEYTWNLAKQNINQLDEIFNANGKLFSNKVGSEGETTFEDHGTWNQKTTIWQNGDLYIKQFMVKGSGTYRVRVLISWK